MDFKNIVKDGAGIQGINLAYPNSEAIDIVLAELKKALIVELDIINHFTTITDCTGKLAEQIFEEQEISFKLKKSL